MNVTSSVLIGYHNSSSKWIDNEDIVYNNQEAEGSESHKECRAIAGGDDGLARAKWSRVSCNVSERHENKSYVGCTNPDPDSGQ